MYSRSGQGEALNVDRQALYSGLFAALAATPLAPFLEGDREGNGTPGSAEGSREMGGGTLNGRPVPGGRQGTNGAGNQPRGPQARESQAGGPMGPEGGAGAVWAAEPTAVLLAAAATTLLVDQVPCCNSHLPSAHTMGGLP